MEHKPIPALYCCYLLRFQQHKTKLYIGSTPNPRRRLAQHLGQTKGGARRTAREGDKDDRQRWGMACIVTGFPSRIAALQFEWAWSNLHLTKRIEEKQRLIAPVKRRGRKKMKIVKPPNITISAYLQHLRLLLQASSFNRWPLLVRFFDEDAHRQWSKAKAKAGSAGGPDIVAVLDLQSASVQELRSEKFESLSTHAKGKLIRAAVGKGGVDGLDVGYTRFREHVEKGMNLLSGVWPVSCVICSQKMETDNQMALVCPSTECDAVSHVTCLASSFLKNMDDSTFVLPTSGKCPSCSVDLQWIDLIKESSLRLRDKREVAQLLKTKVVPMGEADEGDDDTPRDVAGGIQGGDAVDDVPDEPLPDDWVPQDLDSDDAMSVTSVGSDMSSVMDVPVGRPRTKPSKPLEAVIEDSEYDSAEALD